MNYIDLGSGKLGLDLFEIKENNLPNELADHPANFAWWSYLAREARDLALRAKLQLEIFESKLWRDLKSDNSKRVTDKDCERQIKLNEKWRELYEEFLDATRRAEVLESVREALKQKKDLLVALATMKKYELESLKLEVQNEQSKSTKSN